MCQLGSIWASFENAAQQRLMSIHFTEVIPRGCVQTGAKHGNHDVTYVEYMCVAIEKHLVISGQESYLNYIKFRRDNQAEKVRKIFTENMADLDAPIQCPTWAHTFNFNCTYIGVHLIDGECKGVMTPDASLVLVLHSAEQLRNKYSGLSMLTTNTCITFYESVKDTNTGQICITHHELPKYDLDPVTDIAVDLDKTLPEFADPPKYSLPGEGFVMEYEKMHKNIVDVWNLMRTEPKKMVLALLHAIDIIAEYLSIVDLGDVAAKRKRWLVPSPSANSDQWSPQCLLMYSGNS